MHEFCIATSPIITIIIVRPFRRLVWHGTFNFLSSFQSALFMAERLKGAQHYSEDIWQENQPDLIALYIECSSFDLQFYLISNDIAFSIRFGLVPLIYCIVELLKLRIIVVPNLTDVYMPSIVNRRVSLSCEKGRIEIWL